MEALEFIKQKDRMCDYYCGEVCTHDDSGETCPARSIDCEITTDEPKRLVAIVEKWAKEHPVNRNRNGRNRSTEQQNSGSKCNLTQSDTYQRRSYYFKGGFQCQNGLT